MTEEDFQLPKTSYEGLEGIIQAYGKAGEPVNRSEIEDRTGKNPSYISRNIGFLVAVDILTAEGRKRGPTEKGEKLANAISHEIEEHVRQAWREIIRNSDFLKKMVTAVDVRGGMDRESLKSHIAYSAGESKNSRVMTGANTVINILQLAGFLEEEEGGKLTTSKPPGAGEHQEPPGKRSSRAPRETKSSTTESSDQPTPSTEGTRPPQISIEIQIEVPGEDLDESMRQEVSNLIEEISSATRDISIDRDNEGTNTETSSKGRGDPSEDEP